MAIFYSSVLRQLQLLSISETIYSKIMCPRLSLDGFLKIVFLNNFIVLVRFTALIAIQISGYSGHSLQNNHEYREISNAFIFSY